MNFNSDKKNKINNIIESPSKNNDILLKLKDKIYKLQEELS